MYKVIKKLFFTFCTRTTLEDYANAFNTLTLYYDDEIASPKYVFKVVLLLLLETCLTDYKCDQFT